MDIFRLFRKEPEPVVRHGEVKIVRFFDDTKPDRDMTIITYGGMLSPRQKVDIEAIFSGKSTAHKRPGKGVQA